MLTFHHLGLQPYQETWQAMLDFTTSRTSETADQIWLLQHPPVFTQGQAGKAEHILDAGNIPVIQTDRGGQVTYHGPGQVVAYALIDLQRRKQTVRCLVNALEQAVINLLDELNISAERRDKAPGVYVAEAKICSLGLRVKRYLSYHGLALNTVMDLTPFQRINPCGFKQLTMTQIADFVPNVDVGEVESLLVKHLMLQLERHCARNDNIKEATGIINQ